MTVCRWPTPRASGRPVHGQLDRRRLALVVALFESPHDGERLAALEAAGRLLAAGKVSWRDLIDRAAKPTTTADDDEDLGEPIGPHKVVAADLLRRFSGRLTPGERTFLGGLRAFRKLSAKQRGVLDNIRRKVGVAT